MRKLVIFLGLVLFLFTACEIKDNDTGDRLEKKWNEFVQKHFVGEWTAYKVDIRPLIGPSVIEKTYPLFPGCKSDRLVFDKNYSGSMSKYLPNCEEEIKEFIWYHKLGELGFQFKDGSTSRTILLDRSEKTLVFAVPLKEMLNEISTIYPELNELEQATIDLLFVNYIYIKQ